MEGYEAGWLPDTSSSSVGLAPEVQMLGGQMISCLESELTQLNWHPLLSQRWQQNKTTLNSTTCFESVPDTLKMPNKATRMTHREWRHQHQLKKKWLPVIKVREFIVSHILEWQQFLFHFRSGSKLCWNYIACSRTGRCTSMFSLASLKTRAVPTLLQLNLGQATIAMTPLLPSASASLQTTYLL